MLFAGVRARALSGSTPDYPDDEHKTLCGCLCLCVCRFVFVWPSRKGSANELLNWSVCLSVCLYSHTAGNDAAYERLPTASAKQALQN